MRSFWPFLTAGLCLVPHITVSSFQSPAFPGSQKNRLFHTRQLDLRLPPLFSSWETLAAEWTARNRGETNGFAGYPSTFNGASDAVAKQNQIETPEYPTKVNVTSDSVPRQSMLKAAVYPNMHNATSDSVAQQNPLETDEAMPEKPQHSLLEAAVYPSMLDATSSSVIQHSQLETDEAMQEKPQQSLPEAAVYPNMLNATSDSVIQQSQLETDEAMKTMQENEMMWKEIDQELSTIRAEAALTLESLALMEGEVDRMIEVVQQKDVDHRAELEAIERDRQRVEEEMSGQLSSLSNELSAVQAEAEHRQKATQQAADEAKRELEEKIAKLQEELSTQETLSETQVSQLSGLQAEKLQLESSFRRLQSEAEAMKRDWETRHKEEMQKKELIIQQTHADMEEERSKLSQEHSRALQNSEEELDRVRNDLTQQLKEVSHELQSSQVNLRETENVLKERDVYIGTLETAMTNLDQFSLGSWKQINLLEQAMGRTPTVIKGKVPTLKVVQSVASDIIQSFKDKEEYFASTLEQIKVDFSKKENDLNQKLDSLSREYHEFRSEMMSMLAGNEADRSAAEKLLKSVLEETEVKLEEQTEFGVLQAEKARDFMVKRMELERELGLVKREAANMNEKLKQASAIIQELEDKLETEQDERQKEKLRAEKELHEQEKRSLEEKKRLRKTSRATIERNREEYQTQLEETTKDLQKKQLNTNIAFSTILTSAILAGIFLQGPSKTLDSPIVEVVPQETPQEKVMGFMNTAWGKFAPSKQELESSSTQDISSGEAAEPQKQSPVSKATSRAKLPSIRDKFLSFSTRKSSPEESSEPLEPAPPLEPSGQETLSLQKSPPEETSEPLEPAPPLGPSGQETLSLQKSSPEETSEPLELAPPLGAGGRETPRERAMKFRRLAERRAFPTTETKAEPVPEKKETLSPTVGEVEVEEIVADSETNLATRSSDSPPPIVDEVQDDVVAKKTETTVSKSDGSLEESRVEENDPLNDPLLLQAIMPLYSQDPYSTVRP